MGSEDYKFFLEMAYDIEEAIEVGVDYKNKKLYDVRKRLQERTAMY